MGERESRRKRTHGHILRGGRGQTKGDKSVGLCKKEVVAQ